MNWQRRSIGSKRTLGRRFRNRSLWATTRISRRRLGVKRDREPKKFRVESCRGWKRREEWRSQRTYHSSDLSPWYSSDWYRFPVADPWRSIWTVSGLTSLHWGSIQSKNRSDMLVRLGLTRLKATNEILLHSIRIGYWLRFRKTQVEMWASKRKEQQYRDRVRDSLGRKMTSVRLGRSPSDILGSEDRWRRSISVKDQCRRTRKFINSPIIDINSTSEGGQQSKLCFWFSLCVSSNTLLQIWNQKSMNPSPSHSFGSSMSISYWEMRLFPQERRFEQSSSFFFVIWTRAVQSLLWAFRLFLCFPLGSVVLTEILNPDVSEGLKVKGDWSKSGGAGVWK